MEFVGNVKKMPRELAVYCTFPFALNVFTYFAVFEVTQALNPVGITIFCRYLFIFSVRREIDQRVNARTQV